MTDLSTPLGKGEAALTALYALQVQAMNTGNLVSQKALKDDIDDLTYQLTQLSSAEVDLNDAQIDSLNMSLDVATKAANTCLTDIAQIASVLQSTVAAAKLVSKIVQLAAGA